MLPHWYAQCSLCYYREEFVYQGDAYASAAEHVKACHDQPIVRDSLPVSVRPVRYDVTTTGDHLLPEGSSTSAARAVADSLRRAERGNA